MNGDPAKPESVAAGLVSTVAQQLRSAGCVFAEDEAQLLIETAAGDSYRLAHLIERRTAGVPLEPLLGWVSFCGLRIAVEPGVFVPRRKTELLALRARDRLMEVAAEKRRGAADTDRVLVVELCCGVAAISTVLAAEAHSGASPGEAHSGANPVRIELYATDIDPTAVSVARRNLGAKAWLGIGDLYRGLPDSIRHRVDILIANAPYVPSHAIGLMPREAREHEPQLALDGGPDGTAVQRRIIVEAPNWLAPAGRLMIETGRSQAALTAELMESAGLSAQVVADDDRGATIVLGCLRIGGLKTVP